MIAPELATMLAFITTDAAIDARRPADGALARDARRASTCLTVDGDMSTNDAVFALANGLAGNAPIAEGTPDFDRVRRGARRRLRRARARDRRGRRGRDEARRGARDAARRTSPIARDLARAVAGSNLVKAAIFGADPNWGRVLAARRRARRARASWPIDPPRATVHVQGAVRLRRTARRRRATRVALRARMREPHVGDRRRASPRAPSRAPSRGAAISPTTT